MKIEKERVTTDSHSRLYEENHSRRKVKKQNAKANGKRMSQEELDKQITEMREQLNVLRRILEENQRLGWVLKKKPVKWSKLQRRLQQRKVKQLMEKLREAELEMEISIFEAEQGEVLGKDEDWRSVEDLMNFCENSRQQEGLKTETSSETKRSHDFKSDKLCMIAGITGEKQPFEDVFRMDEDLEVKCDKENFSEEKEFDWL